MGKEALWSSCGGQMGRVDHTYVDADVSADFDADQTIDKGESGEREGVFDHRPGSQVSSQTQGGHHCQDTDKHKYTNTKYNKPKMIKTEQRQTQLRELDVHNCPALTAASLQAINR